MTPGPSVTRAGALYQGGGRCHFSVWAPAWERVDLHLLEPEDRLVPLERIGRGYHAALVESVPAGALYRFRLGDGRERADPASRYQPRGVHGPSAVVDPSFAWSDAGYRPPPLCRFVLYEIHVGTFTSAGTFDAAVARLDELRDLGVTALEIMPVAQFPGSRNWGYDGVFPSAVQNSYGGPEGLRRLVDACHARGMAVVLDVVYNHLGLEGNTLGEFGPYFTERYRTPWGAALNFDGPESDEVRRHFIGSALYFLEEFHVDGFRLDAVHAIVDPSARPFLRELADALHARAQELGRPVQVIAESDLNDARVVRPPALGGYGIDAQGCDDFHHALHALLTGERAGYYRDFGDLRHLARAFRDGFVYSGQYSAYRGRRHGNSPSGIAAERFVVSIQNHDQVGNRALGDRLGALVDFPSQKLAACALLLSPFVPLIFMGEEYGEAAPFQYFTSHSEPGLVEAVRRGRRAEFAAFGWKDEDVPDPQDEATFARSRLRREQASGSQQRALRELYAELLRVRLERPALCALDRERTEVSEHSAERSLVVRRWNDEDEALAVLCFAEERVTLPIPGRPGGWRKRLDTEEARWRAGGSEIPEQLPGAEAARLVLSPRSCLLFTPAEVRT